MSTLPVQSYMLAASTPLLKNENLCPFLTKIDEKETKDLQEEEQRVAALTQELDKQYPSEKESSSLIGMGIGITAFIAGIALSFLQKPEATNSMSIGMAGVGCVLAITSWHRENLKEIGKNSFNNIKSIHISSLNADIAKNRILRLKDKVREIKRELSLDSTSTVKEQLLRAKDYFKQKKVELKSSQETPVNVEHYHYV